MLKIGKIKELLNEKGMQQKEFAEAIGVNPSFISLMFDGKRTPKPDTFCKMATVLGVEPGDLVD